MTRARELVAYLRQLRVGVRDRLVSFDDTMDGGLAFGDQSGETLARNLNLLIEALRFGLALDVYGSRALAFAGQPFGLQCEPFERRLKLAADLHQALGHSRVM